MATPGLALIGFMTKEFAAHFLANDCAPANPSPAALDAEWRAAVAAKQPPLPNAGSPTVTTLPSSHTAYEAKLRQSPDWQNVFAANPHWQIKMVEIAPLLAYQFSVLDGKANSHGSGFSGPPSLDELLSCCLPLAQTNEGYFVAQAPNSVLIQARSLNVRPIHFGESSPGMFSLQIGVALPFVHVVRFAGKCFLHNGYHRSYAALAAGATEIPCIFRDVTTPQEVGISPGTFDLQTLMSANPPTLNDLANGHLVDLIVKTRTVHLSWTDWVTPEI